MFKLKDVNGRVEYLHRSGKDYVKGTVPILTAQLIADCGKLVESKLSEYPICIDNVWYFKGSRTKDIKEVEK